MIYTTGTIAISGNTVTGTGTNFSAPLSLIRVGCTLIAIGNPVQIFTITEIKSGTELSVTPAANPAIPAGTKFSILLSDSISVDGLAQDVSETLRYYQGKETEIAAAVEWWKDFGGDGQMEQLLADIRAETAQSTANAQKTESDKNAAAASKTAAANSATAAKASQDAAKASETAASGSKTAAATSETNAAKSAADALNYRNQAQGIVGTDIGLGANRRDWPDCNDPTGYIGFCRAEASTAKNFPSIASGELYLVGWLARGDGATINGCFVGTVTRSLYTYSYNNADKSVAWMRHARKDEVDRFSQLGSDQTRIYSGNGKTYFEVGNDRAWGVYNGDTGQWKPLELAQGGTGATSLDNARTNLGLGRGNSPQLDSLFLDKTSDSTSDYTSSGILHTRLLASDNTVRLAGDMYVQTYPNEQGRLTIRFTCGGSNSTTRCIDLTSEGNLLVDSAILKSTIEKPLQINSVNPAIRFDETDRPANTPTYTLAANAGDWFIQKRDYDDAGSVSNAIAYNFANDRLDVTNIKASGNVTCVAVNQSSDRDLKDNILVISDATEAIRKMNGYTYTLKENGLPYAGVIAQEVMEALPEAVGSFTHYGEALQGPTIDGNELREETRYLNVDYAAVTGLLVQVARETDNRVTELEEENASLRANIAVMDERITKLEALVRQLTGSEK